MCRSGRFAAHSIATLVSAEKCDVWSIENKKINRRLLEKFSSNFGPPSVPLVSYNLWWKVAKSEIGRLLYAIRTKLPRQG